MRKIAAIDVGLKRIGLALCLGASLVTPQEAILRKNRDQAAREVDLFLHEWQIDTLVVGLPKGGASAEEMERRIKHFINLLTFKAEVVYVDEYGSSHEAKERMKGVVRQKKDGRMDSIAAQVILERYLMIKAAAHE